MRNVSVQQTNAVHVPHERQERRPHKEFTTACNIHLISNTPPRCEAIRHSATMRSSKCLAFWYVMSVHRYATHTRCSTKFRGCTLQRSLDDWPTCGSVPRRAYRSVHTLSHVRLDVQRHCTVCERFPTCRHAVVAQIHEVIARVCSVFDRNPIDRFTTDMLSAT